MNAAVRVEALSLIEKMNVDELPVTATAIMREWCLRTGQSDEGFSAVLARMTRDDHLPLDARGRTADRRLPRLTLASK